MNISGKKPRNRQRRQSLRSRKGTAIVELAILLPILVLIVIGIFEIGSSLKAKSSLTFVCRSACNFASKPTSSNKKVVTETRRLLAEANLPAEQAVIDIFVNDKPDETALASRNDKIAVSVAIPNKTMFPFYSGIFGGRSSTCQEKMVMCKQ